MALLLALVMSLVCAAAEEPLRLEVTEHTDVHHEFTGIAKSYGVTITNLTDGAVTIERGILIEMKTPKGWSQEMGIQAVSSCTDFDGRYHWKAPIRLAAHSSLAVVPWDGFSCGGQCISSCQQNVQEGPGIFRFVVVIVPGGKRIASPPFNRAEKSRISSHFGHTGPYAVR